MKKRAALTIFLLIIIFNSLNSNAQLEASSTTNIIFGQEPTPIRTGGGGSNSYRPVCCNYVTYNSEEYLCDCAIREGRYTLTQPSTCCRNPTATECTKFCTKIEIPTGPTISTIGICPVERMCGNNCCETGEICRNGQCIITAPIEEMQEIKETIKQEVQTPKPQTNIIQEETFTWWYAALGGIAILFLAYLLFKIRKRK